MPENSRSFAVPQGWVAEDAAGFVTLTGPEGDLRISFVETDAGLSPRETALAAWRRIQPDFASNVQREMALPPQGGWQQMHQIVYEAPASEARIELAVVRILGNRAFVNLVRGSAAAVSRRGAQISEAFSSWKPPGYTESNLQNAAASPWTDAHSRNLREFALPAMETLQIPGVSLAIVQGGRLVYAEGFGVRALGETAPVTPHTPFLIGSTTKPLTTLLMARLIDRGRLSWSTPVRDLLPGFALADPEITRRLELRHTASASTGMPRQDAEFIFKFSGITPNDRIAQMRNMRPTTGFGETFQYSNVLVAAGGYAAARAYAPDASLESAFDRAMQDMVFGPLGMANSFLRPETALEREPALPHAMDFTGTMSSIPVSIERAVYSVAPAGAVWSTVTDLARYLLLELGAGRMPDGERLVSEPVLLERRQRGIKIDDKSSYGLGLFVSQESGLQVVHHGGNTLGFTADLFFLPEKDLGAVVLTNAGAANALLLAIRQKIFELVLGAEAKASQSVAAAAKIVADGGSLLRQKVTTDPAAMEWVDQLAGTYHCPELGSARVSRREEGFWMQCDEWGSALGAEVQPGGDRLLRLVSPPWRGTLKFLVEDGGKSLLLDQAQQKYVFRRSG